MIGRKFNKFPYFAVLAVSLFVAVPCYIWVYPDSEDLHSTLFSTFAFSEAFRSGTYPFWNTLLGFGTPLPLSNSLYPHPLFIFFSPDSLHTMLGLFVWVQTFVGTLSVYLISRKLGVAQIPATIGGVTFSLCSASIFPIFIKFIPVHVLSWTLIPLILLLILHLVDESCWTMSAIFKTVALGGITGALLVTGHIGTVSGFALPIMLFAVMLAIRKPAMLQFLIVAGVLSLLISADKFYLLWTEVQISTSLVPNQERVIQHFEIGEEFDYYSFWSFFFKPFVPTFSYKYFVWRNIRFGDHTDPIWRTLIFIGPPFALLAVTALFVRFRKREWYFPVMALVLFSLFMMFLPKSFYDIQMIISTNVLFVPPFMLFATILATMTLDEIGARTSERARMVFQAVGVLQIGCLVLGVLPNMVVDRLPSTVYKSGLLGHVEVLQGAKPLAEQLKLMRSFSSSRVYLSEGVEEHGPAYISNWGGSPNNSLAIMGMAQVGGYFKPTAMEMFEPDNNFGASEIHGRADVLRNKDLLDVMGIEFILALDGEDWSSGLHMVEENVKGLNFVTRHGKKLILLSNPNVLPLAFAVDKELDKINLPIRPNCGHAGLMCRDFSILRSAIDPSVVDDVTFFPGGRIRVALAGQNHETILLMTQLYRAGWTGRTNKGQTLDIHPAFEGFMATRVPAGVREIEFAFKPRARIFLSLMQNFLLLGCLATLGIFAMHPLICRQIKEVFANQREADDALMTTPSLWTALRNRHAQRLALFWLLVGVGGYVLGFVIYKVTLVVTDNLILSEAGFFLVISVAFGIVLRQLWNGLCAQ